MEINLSSRVKMCGTFSGPDSGETMHATWNPRTGLLVIWPEIEGHGDRKSEEEAILQGRLEGIYASFEQAEAILKEYGCIDMVFVEVDNARKWPDILRDCKAMASAMAEMLSDSVRTFRR